MNYYNYKFDPINYVDGKGKRAGKAEWKRPNTWAKHGGRVLVGEIYGAGSEELAAVRDEVFDLIEELDGLTWLLLTEHPDELLKDLQVHFPEGEIPAHVWVGVTGYLQDDYDFKTGALAQAVDYNAFLVMQPDELVDIDLRSRMEVPASSQPHIKWVILDGGKTPIRYGWIESMRNECKLYEVPFWFNGWGDYVPAKEMPADEVARLQVDQKVSTFEYGFEAGDTMYNVGRKNAAQTVHGELVQDDPF